MNQASMPVIIPRINENIASVMATPYRMLLLVKRQILRDAAIQSGIALVYLYTCLNPRYVCVTKAASTVPRGVNMYGHGPPGPSMAVRTRFKGDMFTHLQELLDYHNSLHWMHSTRVDAMVHKATYV